MKKKSVRSKAPLKTVVLCSRGHLWSIIVLNQLMKMKCYDVTTVVRAQKVQFTRKWINRVKRQTEKTWILFMAMLVLQQFVQEIFFLIPFWRKTKKITELSEQHKFKIHDTDSINNKETEEILKEINPDIIISAYFPQILKPRILKIPSRWVLNIHPWLIPSYKWVMAYFWALKNNAKKAWVSIHWMDEWIDTWPIIGMRSFRVSPRMSQDKVMIKTAKIWSILLRRIWYKLRRWQEVKVISVSQKNVWYYSLPSDQQFREYRNVRSFFSFRTLLKTILWISK